MIAAVYARKSTEQTGVTADARSVARQLADTRAFAEVHRWTLDDAHTYIDDGISGAEFARRPGLVRLLATLKPRPPFGVLLVSDRDRIGREQIETSYVLKQLITAGVRVFEVDHAREITLSSPTDKVLSAVTAFASELEREQARSRTHAALAHRARAGRSTGGRTFGYETTRAVDGTVTRTIAPAEAEVVRRIFALTAEGHGRKAIAQRLNADGAPSPRKAGRMSGWAPSSVRDALGNELYRGVLVWNRTKRRDDWGQRHKGKHDAAEVLRVDVPDVRIIDEPLWARAQEKLAAGRELYAARNGTRNGTRNGGRPASGSASKYLLSGLATCGQCGGSMFIHRRDRIRAATWGCTTRHLRGVTICKNSLEVPLTDTDTAVLAAVEHDLLNVAVLETALYKAMEMLRPDADATDGQTHKLREELARLDAEVARLAGAIAAGGDMPALVAALQDRERRRGQVRAQLAQAEREVVREAFDADKVLARLRDQLADVQGLLRGDVASARQVLQALLAGRITFTPGEQDGRRFYTFEAEGTVAPIIAGIVDAPKGSGARTRTIPPAIRRALHHRDHGCRFPGCGLPFGQGHHIRHWAKGGPTTLSNLAMLCRRHHRAVHEEEYQVERQPDGELKFRRPDGRPLPDVPPPSAIPNDPVGALRARNEAAGLHLNARTACPGWLGESLNVGWAISVLHPRALQPSAIGE